MEPKFRVGDLVQIGPLKEGMPFGICKEMQSLVGCYFFVEGVKEGKYRACNFMEYLCDGCLYDLSGKASKWCWSNPMFVLVKKADEVKAELAIQSDSLQAVYTKVDDTRTKDETSFIDEVQKSLDRIASACGVPKSILSSTDKKCEPLKLAIKKHIVKLNFKN